MATTVKTSDSSPDSAMDGSAHLAVGIPVATAPVADEISRSPLSLAVEEDLGAVELYDEYVDWKRSYADSVGMSLHEKIR